MQAVAHGRPSTPTNQLEMPEYGALLNSVMRSVNMIRAQVARGLLKFRMLGLKL
jgi:hypothetical protein